MIVLQVYVMLQVPFAFQNQPTLSARINLTLLRMCVSHVSAQMFHFLSTDRTHFERTISIIVTAMDHLRMLLEIFRTFEG